MLVQSVAGEGRRNGGSMGASLVAYRPKVAAQLVGIGPSTLRVYSHMFGDLLSEAARPGLSQRRYEVRDIEVLKRARALLDGGLTFDLARVQLQHELEAWPGSFTFRGDVDRVASLETRVADLEALVAAKDEAIALLQRFLAFHEARGDRLFAETLELRRQAVDARR